MNKDKDLTITENKKALKQYDKSRVKKLKEQILVLGVSKILLDRTNSKLIYTCQCADIEPFYEVFINFLKPTPIIFFTISFYDYTEIYPSEEEFNYRAWRFESRKEALDKYLSLE